MAEGSTWIYGLREKDADEIRYIGASVDPLIRYRSHLSSTNTSKVMRAWIEDCREREISIELVCLESIPYRVKGSGCGRHPQVAEAEDRWIVNLLDDGHRLLNKRVPPTHNGQLEEMQDAIERGRAMFGSR